MPANNQKPASQTPASPRNTAKYTNKDGSKFITVPKGSPSESSLPPTPTTTKASAPPPDASNGPAPTINRKKQKRRQKAAAKLALQQQTANGHDAASGAGSAAGSTLGRGPADHEEVESDDEHEYVLASEVSGPTSNGHPLPDSKSKKKNKKKKKGGAASNDSPQLAADRNPPSQPNMSRGSGMSRDKIWSTSNQEERERIKEFWLGLGEDERKSLVKVEKDAVLKKMKEQQKHTCSCTVCGRKRNAIEEELEGLYDAYYLELEQFANQGEAPTMLPTPRDFSLRPPRGLPSSYGNPPPSRGRIVEHVGDDEDEDDLEEVYSEDGVEDDDYSDDEPPEEFHNPHDRDVADFLTFGNSLQVKGTQLLESLLHRYGNMDLGGILTVADDLLKNDGKRFIEMMEQLAERRMAREEDAREHFSRGYGGHPNGSYSNPHNHPPPDDDEYDDEEDEEEDYDDSQDEEYEDEEVYSNPSVMPPQSHTECCCQDQMTEEQRMEEGRRMFQIFAARMFEQRVLSAYKEKVAKERQQKLLEELEDENRLVEQQKAKKAKNAQKKKDKAAQKKQAQAEERARKEAEKAAEEAARQEAEKQRIAQQKARSEEKRKQKEAYKKAEEEARLRKEAERQRQREKQAEQERKAREAKEKEKKLKEEQRQREKEAREQKEREAQERKDKQDRDKREKEARAAKAQKEAQAAREAKEKLKEEKAAAHKAATQASQPLQIPKRGQQHPVSIPTALPQHPPNPNSYASPKIPVATPVIPKAPTPMRPRTMSQQQDTAPTSSSASQSASATSQNPSPHSLTPAHMSPGPIGQRKSSASTTATTSQHSHSVSPTNAQSRIASQPIGFQMPPMGIQPPPGLTHAPPGFPNRIPHEAMFPPGFRHSPNVMMPPPGIHGAPGRGFPPASMPPPGFHQAGDQFGMGGFPMPKDVPPPVHTRQSSGQFDIPPPTAQPIGRPAPIGRPGSVSMGRMPDDLDDETTHLGSRALLEDDEPLASDVNPASLRNQPPGFPTGPFMPSGYPMAHNPWGPPAGGTFPPPGFGNPGWGAPSAPPGFGMGSPVPSMSAIRSTAPARHVAVRQMLCQACKALGGSGDSEGFIDLSTIKSQIDDMTGDNISEIDLLNLCETEGSPSNGGGAFDLKRDVDGSGKHRVRWQPDPSDGFNPQYRAVGAPGEIGSPLMGHVSQHVPQRGS
ncbi:Stress response protein NST1 [Fusarium keratoplasticum]|uniref:Stress response protein NST1 n=1 Tax=Fusarium keratoplasticum TaxID=1328300 RepID=A0ACC0QTS5_9HYPO|nr:Stress response protein NST1 [Fusarium keratoplasticum]KAI8666042.1 Stress response protein NST1 [Fusarium keratoplasticum]KAI8667750.1 Stress response protein NST1 [Fusarium keratoplasticum]